MAAQQRELGMRLVILYKTVKGAAEAVLALLLAFGAALGLAARMQDVVASLAAHLTRDWSLQLAETLFNAATTKHLQLAAIGLGIDAVLTSVEAWGLIRRRRWAPWLVVVASSLLVPWEVLEILKHASVVKVVIFVINLAIVLYLARRIAREHREHLAAEAGSGT